MRFFASASRGTEEVLAGELAALGARGVEVGRGGVGFGDRLEDGYRACVFSRVASRVLLPLTRFEAVDAATLYDGVHAVAWTEHLGPERTLMVSVAGKDAPAGPPHFIALKTKDAIVDRVREAEGTRPDVDKRRPDVRIHVHVRGPVVTVSLDLAGRALHRRGLGRSQAPAPLKENLAAALLLIAGWRTGDERPLYDPLCGSGTFLIEAASIARDVAPGLARERAGAERLRSHDAGLWRRVLDEARERRDAARRHELRIAGADASRVAVAAAREIATRAGFGDLRVAQRDLDDSRPPWDTPGLIVTNPPYGARLGEAGELGPLYERLGDLWKRRFPGWTAWLLSGNRALDKRVGLRPAARHVVWNGPIECRFLEIPLADAPATGATGPGWRRPGRQARGFETRLRANVERLTPWAAAEGLTAYRLYDSDVPEFNLAVDRYGDAVRVEEYPRPRRVDPAAADERLHDAVRVVADVLEVPTAAVAVRVRRRLAPGEQHERYEDRGRFLVVNEGDLRFRVNLTDYLDTGLFLDDRLLRRLIRERARDRDVLNLFAYTCAASVAAAAGGARSTTSVDLSQRYLDWGRANFALNDIDPGRHRFVRGDATRPPRPDGRPYGLIFAGPPTRSRSKAMRGEFDVQRDHRRMLTGLARRLTRDGEILFTTNMKTFVLDRLPGLVASEISAAITPLDFERRPLVRAWRIVPAARASE